MAKKKLPTSRRIYSLLRKQPGLTTVEIYNVLSNESDISFVAVSSAIHGMLKRAELEPLGMRTVQRDGMRCKTCKTYRVKYKSRAKVEAPEVEAPEVEAPEVEAPEVVNTFRPVVAPSSTFEPIPPVSDSFRKAYEHLAMINSETMLELHETKKALAEAEKAHNCWWCRLKKAFV